MPKAIVRRVCLALRGRLEQEGVTLCSDFVALQVGQGLAPCGLAHASHALDIRQLAGLHAGLFLYPAEGNRFVSVTQFPARCVCPRAVPPAGEPLLADFCRLLHRGDVLVGHLGQLDFKECLKAVIPDVGVPSAQRLGVPSQADAVESPQAK